MVVVDRVEHEIFIVPAEGGVLHPYIQPRQVYAIYIVGSGELHQTIRVAAEIVQVPGVLFVFLLVRVYHFLAFVSESRPKLACGYVCSILYSHEITLLIIDHLPIIFLKILVIVGRSFLLGSL